MNNFPIPLLGFCAYSGTGKTTLLTKLLPLLKDIGLNIAVVKHAHHRFDIDHPGKDSYELRKAGADQMLVASRNRIAFMKETPDKGEEPVLEDVLSMLSADELDLVLVEGFKHAKIPKIELHRPSLNKPLMYPHDRQIIAIATDAALETKPEITQLDLNSPSEIVTFILERFITPAAKRSCL